MEIQKRSFPVYVLQNCLTLGIYGFIVNQQIEKEINALCKGDGEKPALSYAMAVMIRGISTFLGLITGLVFGLLWPAPGPGVIVVFVSILVFGFGFTLIGSVISGIYLNYWWYRQASRMKLNANRYNFVINEGGTDIYLFRTVLNLLFIPITIILLTLSFLVPGLIAWMITLVGSIGAFTAAVIIVTVFAIPLMLFSPELTTGGLFSIFFVIKNLNRYAEYYRSGATPFDVMEYEYYPSIDNFYIRSLPDIVDGIENLVGQIDYKPGPGPDTVPIRKGGISGLNGSCAGFDIDISDGEEIIIGKDARESHVLIDAAYKEISRKHVGVIYDCSQDVYRVTDYSSNGTWANGEKLQPGIETIQKRGTILQLATDKNIFRLD